MNEITKTLLIASFVPKTNIDWFIKYLDNTFLIKKENIFIYEISDNEDDYLLTFKLKNNKKIDLKFYFSNATIINIKNGCIFSINGLNKLIELETNCEKGNVDYNNHKIKWDEYIDKLILSSKDKLLIKTIKKIKFND